MNTKIYESPHLEVVEIEVESILCASEASEVNSSVGAPGFTDGTGI